MVQDILINEFREFIGVERCVRLPKKRRGYRHGYYWCYLTTRVSRSRVMVPRDRDGDFSTELFKRYQRHDKALVLALVESYLGGVSARKVSRLNVRLCGKLFLPQHLFPSSELMHQILYLIKFAALKNFRQCYNKEYYLPKPKFDRLSLVFEKELEMIRYV